jgi:hypothetical protein
MKLPFTKVDPFPASAFNPPPEMSNFAPMSDPNNRPKFTGLPAGAQGVETQARMAQPAPMGFQTPASDRLAALGRSGAPTPLPSPIPAQAPMMMPAQPAMRQAPINPLGGMDPRPLSGRGGPMSYSQQGVGTNNPNAYAVGQNRAPVGMRMLERAARRRDPRAIMALASMEQQNAQQGQQMNMMQMREAADALRFDQQQQNQMTMFELQQQAAQQRDATNFGQQKEIMQMQSQQRAGESALEFQRRQEAEAAQRAAEGVVGVEQMKMDGGFVPMVRRADGTMSMAGSFMPAKPVEAPLPAGLVPTGAIRGGVQYGPAETAQTGKAPAFTYEKDPNGRITGAVYPVQDPQTGQWRLQRADLNGDGVISPTEAAAASAAAPAQGAALKTKAGNSYTFK